MVKKSLEDCLIEKGWNNLVPRYIIFGIVADILKSIDGGSITAPFTLSFCCIDYMGRASNPNSKDNNPILFKGFIKTFMGKFNPEYINKNEELYATRCSLIHTHGYSNKTFQKNIFPSLVLLDNSNHLNIDSKTLNDGRKRFVVSLANLVTDLICGIEEFFRETKDPKLLKEWISKFAICNLFINDLNQFSLELALNNNNKFLHHHHEILGLLDNGNELTLIRNELLNKISLHIDKYIVQKQKAV